MKQSLHPSRSIPRVVVACLLAFTILIMPIAAVAAPSIARATLSTKTNRTDKTNKTDKAKSADEELFVNPPTAMPAAALPGPKPEPAPEPLAPFLPGPVTATMTAALTPTANNGNGQADPGDTINYTAILTNTGSDPTGLMSLNDFMDSHTSFVAGSIKSTPVCFDQSVSTNEDVAKAITLTGEDPDGDGITFSIVSGPSNGSLNPGVAGASQTYTPAANFFGADSFTFRVNDGTTSGAGANGNSNETCTVSITVNPVNDAPTFTVPGNPAAVNEDAGAQSVATFISPASVRPAQSGNTTEDAQTVSFVITNNTNPGLFSTPPAINVAGGAYPKTATLTYTSAANQNGTATITYHAHDDGGTSPGVDNSADQTFTITVNAVNDPPVVVAPAAFAVQANMKRTGLTGLLGNVNDNADNGVNGCTSTTFTVTSGSISATTPAGGVVSNLNLSAGTFDFEPPPGFTGGNATFTYTVSDTGCPGVGISAPVTVTVAVSGTVIWFVNPAAGVNGTGTLASPFNLLASANTAMGVNAGQRIFVYTGTTTSGVGVTLTTSQWLIGQGAIGTDFDTLMGISPPANTIARPTISTSGTSAANRPTIQGKVAMNGSSTKVLGINITPPANTQGLTATNGSAPGAGTALTGLQLGASPTSDVIVSTTGASGSNAMGVSLTNAGGNFNFISVTTNGGLGISADTIGSGSTMNFGPVSISNRSGTGVFINNAQGTITFGATTIPNPADAGGYGIRIDNSSATVTIPTATISDPHTVTAQTDPDTDLIPNTDGDGDAIFLKNNTGSFTLSGGTLSNCGNDCIDGRTVQTLTLTNVTIDTPGQETGGQGQGGHGISLIDVSGTSNLTGLLIKQFLRSQVDGFRAINTNKNATVNVINCRFENTAAAGASDGNDGLFFEGRGTSNMTTVIDEASPDATHFSRFQGLFGDGIQISTGAVSTGKMTTTVKNTDFKDAYQGLTQTGSGNNGLRIAGVGGGKHAVDIQNNIFLNVNKPLFAQGVISLFINDNSEVKGTIAGNTITNATQAGIQVFADNAAGQTITDMDLIIQNNTLDNISSQGIIVQMTVTGGTLAGCDFRILNNNIGQTTPVGDGEVMFGFGGGPNSSAEGILFSTRGTPKTCNLKVANNNVKINANGVNAGFPPSNEVLQLSVSESATLNATVQNNQLLELDDIANGAAFFGQSFGAGTPNVCLDFTGNTGNTNIDFFLQKAAGGSFVIENVANVVAANTGVWSPANPSASGYANSAGCTEPPVGITQLWVPDNGQKDYLAARPETALQNSRAESLAFLNIKTDFVSIFGSFPGSFHRDTQSAPTVPMANETLSSQVIAGVEGWRESSESRVSSLEFRVKTEQDNQKAERDAPARVADAKSDGAPYGPRIVKASYEPDRGSSPRVWEQVQPQSGAMSIAPARRNDSQLRRSEILPATGTNIALLRSARTDSGPQVYKHPVPTGLKLNHARRALKANNSARTRSVAPMPVSGGTFPINGTGPGFILLAGKSTTITFSATLNNPPNLAGPISPQVQNHGTLSGAFSNNPIDTNTVTTVVDLFDSTTTVTSLPTSSNTGQPVTFTAAIGTSGSPSGSGTNRTGTVDFRSDGITIPGCGAQTVSSNQATCTTSGLSTATHVITALYTGDGNFDPSNGTLAGGQVVTQSGTTTAVTSSLDPSLVTQNVIFTATVTSNTGVVGPPTGTVQFKDNGLNLGAAQTLNGSGVATLATSALAAGTHPITAEYSGDTNFATSTGTLATDPQDVNKSDTTTLLGSSVNPSTPTQNVTFTATVSSSTSVTGPPTGTVTFMDGVNPLVCDNGSTSVQTLSAGAATCDTNDLTTATHSITAVYGGDPTFNGNTSNAVSQEVSQTATTTALVSSSNPSAPAVNITFTATVSAASGTPTGTVTFMNGVNPLVCDNGSTSVQPLTGVIATCDTNDLPELGSPHSITAVYSGDTTFSGSTSNTVLQVITSCSASVVVTNTTDSGAGSLRAAITTGVCEGGTITFDDVAFAAPGPYTIELLDANGELLIGKSMTITGPGASVLTVKRAAAAATNFRVFEIAATKTVTISGMTISNGNVVGTAAAGGSGLPGGAASGGGIFNAGILTLLNVVVSGNKATGGIGGSSPGIGGAGGDAKGGGIFSSGSVTLTNTTVNGTNSATGGKGGDSPATNGTGGAGLGGGVYSLGTLTLTLTNSTIAGNTATGGAPGTGGVGGSAGSGSGGGIYNDGSTAAATATITNSTISTNTASLNGGGIFNIGVTDNATLTITNSTISGNTANNNGGGIFNQSATGNTTLTSVTVTGNRADNDTASGGTGGGINRVSGTVTLKNTIVAGNFVGGSPSTTADDIAGTLDATSTYNLIGDAASSGGLTDGGGNKNIVGNAGAGTIVITTILNPTLADNGGPTRTHALVNGSPALEKGNAFALTTDQRGFTRPVNFDSIAPIAPYDDTDIGAYELQVTPGTPNAPDLDATSDTGVSSTDNLTSDTSPTFTITGVTSGATVELLRDVSPGTGTLQVETATVSGGPITSGTNQVVTLTVLGTVTVAGDASVTVTAVGMTGTPKTILVAVDPGNADAVAVQIRAALTADPNIGDGTTGFFTVSGTGPDVVLTAKVKAANDGTMKLKINSCACTGLTTPVESVTTISGVAPGNATVTVTATGMNNSPKTLNVAVGDGDTAAQVAVKMRAALSADPDISAFFTIAAGPLPEDIKLTAKTAAADDAFLNIATNNGTCTGLTPAPTSANTPPPGAAGPVVVASGIAAGTSIQLTDPSVAASVTPYLYTARQTVSGAPRSPQSASLSVTIDNPDTTAPTVSITAVSPDPRNTSVSSITIVLSEPVSGFDLADLTLKRNAGPNLLTGGQTLTSGDNITWTLGNLSGLTGTAGTYVLKLTASGSGIIDTSSNPLVTDATDTWVVETTAPTVSITAVSPDPRNTSVSSITIVFSEAVTGFDLADLTLKLNAGANLLTGGQTLTSGDNVTWTLGNLSGLTGTEGTYVLKLTASGAGITDTAGNALVTDATDTWVVDTTAPTVSITAVSPDPRNTSVSSIQIVFSEAITGFDLADLSLKLNAGANLLTGGQTLTSGDNVTWTLGNLSGLTGTEGTYVLKLTASGAGITDTVGNALVTDATDTWVMDTTAPTVSITAVSPDPRNTSVSSITIVFSEAVSGFDLADLTLTRNAGANLLTGGQTLTSGDNITWTLGNLSGLTGTEGTYVLKLTASGAGIIDTAGNALVTDATDTWVTDTTAPSVAMTSGVGNPTATTPIPVTVTFSESVTGFTAGNIVSGNGTVSNFAGGPTIYTFDLTPTSPGAVSADIAAGVATDTAGNTNTAATQFNRTFDPSALSVSITAVSPDPRNTSVSSIQIVFNKAVTGFDLADLTLKLNAGLNLLTGAQTLTSGDNITWTLGNLSGLTGAEGTYVLLLTAAGSGIQDPATNPLTSDATDSWVTDTTVPDVTINQAAGQVDPVTGTTAGTVINFTVIFTEPVVLGSFTNSDITISGSAGATVANISQIAPNDGTTFNVGIEGMTQSGTVIADIAAGAAQDAAGNGNTVGTFTDHTVTFNKDDFTTLEVNTTDDSDDGACTPLGGGGADCTLREAILAANADAGAETITFNSVVFAAPGPYTINLTGALPDLSSDMTISGPGAKVLTVRRDTGGDYRIFFIPSGNVTIDGLTMSNGNGGLNAGGGINNLSSGTVNVTNSTISGNSAITGGGIATIGTTLNVSNTTISGNSSPSGGGIYAGLGTVNITNSTISGNAAASDGGGVLSGATLTISNSTIAFNRADNDNNASGTGGGINRSSGTVTLRNTIVGQNFNDASPSITADDVSGAVNSEGFNLIQSILGATITETLNAGTNITGVDPLLFPLADNGGPTRTHALQCTSPAIDKGFNFTLTTDQRGGVRPFDLADAIYPNAASPGNGSDIGAYETQTGGGCQPVAVPPAPQPSTNEDTPVVITLTGTYSQNFALTFAVTQAPAHGSLGSISAPNCVFTLSMTCTSTVTYTPSANSNGLDSFKFKTSASGLDSDEADVNITVVSVNDAPVANGDLLSNIAEDSGVRTIPFADLTANDSPGPANEAGQALTVISVSSPVGGTVSILATDVLFTPTANYHGPASFQYKIRDNGTTNGLPDPKDSVLAATASFTIDPVADTPSVTNATTIVNTQTTSGLVITRNAADGAEVTNFKITNIQNGNLFQTDGTTPILNDAFITVAEGGLGLKFTPANNLSSPGTTFSFQAQASLDNTNGGLGGSTATATITVNCGPTVVTNSSDSGAGSLRAIIGNACPGSTITFDMTPGNVTSPITLSSQLSIDKSLTIQGPGANLLTIAGNNTFRLIDASAAGVNLSISGLSFTGGGVQGGAAASVIEFNNAGTLTLTNCEVFANSGAAAVSVLSAIQSTGVTVDGSTFRNNTANHSLKADRTPLRVVNSTFSGNTGAAILNASAGSTVTNSTIANNQTGIQSDSLLCSGCAASVTVTNTLFSSNGSLNLLLAGTATITSGGHNLIDDSTAAAFSAPDASNLIIPAGTARIAPLANNGGPTQTHALLAGSPALDAGDNAAVANPPFSGAAPFNDQRGAGFPRIVDGPDADTTDTVDIGAFESLLSVEDITDKTTNEDTQLQFIFNVGGAASITSVTATPANTTLVPNNAANIAVTGSGSTRTLTINPAANEFGTSLITVTVNGTNGQSMTDTFVLTVNSVNDVPSFIKGADQTVNEDAGAQSVAWATSISVGPLNEAAQTAAFLVTGNTNPGLFSAGPAISPTGTLTYTPATNINGSASITIVLKDNGGTAFGGVDTSAPQTFTITVNSVNDAPSFTKGADQTVNEDAGAQSVTNWATNISVGPPNEAGQTAAFLITGNTNPGLFSAGPAISPTGTLTYTPAANANGTAGLTIVLKDNGGTADGGVDTSAAQNLVITVNPINDAPVNSVPGAQNGTLNATLVFSAANANLISISDVDAGSDPVRVTLKATDGTLTLSTTSGLVFTVGDGTGDPLMTFTGSIANINAALNGMGNLTLGSGIIEITTNDQGRNGAGGALSDTDTIQVTVIDNLAPVLLTIPGTDRAIAFESPTFLIDPFSLVGNNNFTADHRTHIMIFALHAQLRPGETASAITAEADVSGEVVPLIVESVNTVPNFDWLSQIVVKFPDGFSTGGGGPHDAKIRIRLRGQNSNQAVIIIVPGPTP